MIITYESKTGNVRRFARKLQDTYDIRLQEIHTELDVVNEPFVHITYTTGFGQVPAITESFIKQNQKHLLGIAVSGNRNWGTSFGLAGNTLSATYGVPLLLKFEMSGTLTDLDKLIQEVKKIDK